MTHYGGYMTIIYVMRNTENNTVYIGQTKNSLDNRLMHHKGQIGYDRSSIHQAMKEIGADKFYMETLNIVSDDIANKEEVRWMNYFINNGYKLYNDKLTEGKCGGDTLTNHKNLKEIGEKISSKCRGADNSNSVAVIAIDVINNTVTRYSCMKECQTDLKIDRHDIISRRCRGLIKKPYLGRYMFKYDESHK